ncbi:MAG: HEAT repeat domain-containing protein [Planctomycetota bacterium]
MLRLPAVCLVLALAGLVLAQADPAAVEEAIKGLRSKYYDERQDAKDALIRLGDAAVPRVVETLKDDDYRARAAACEVLGALRREGTLDALVGTLADEDEMVRKAAIDAIIAFGEAGREALAKAGTTNPAIADTVQEAVVEFTRVEVEKRLDTRVTARNGFGFYKDQFENVLALGKPAVEVLLEMFTNPDYDFQAVRDPKRQEILRILAGEALGDSGETSVVPRLKEFMDQPTEDVNGTQLADAAMYSLFKLGEKSYMEAKKEQVLALVQSNPEFDDSYRRELAEVLVRMGDLEQAELEYQKIVATNPDDGRLVYNLSCIYSLRGKKELSLKTLKEAIDLRFDDYEWIRLDKDLDNIRGEEGFKMILREGTEEEKEEGEEDGGGEPH